jgi:CspA family cold shock protein
MQGVVLSYDPQTGEGVVIRETDRERIVFAADALEGSVMKLVRQGQRVVFDLDGTGRATAVRFGSEPDMGTSGADV